MSHSTNTNEDDVSIDAKNKRTIAIFDAMFKGGRSFSGHERHCVYLNTGGKRFANVSAASGLDYDDDGRAVALVDWDQDGDLDLWISNRTAPRLRFFRNDVSKKAHYVALRLQGNGTSSNRDAIGARVEVITTKQEHKRIKTLRAGEGFLAQSSKWLHFGLGKETTIEKVVVRWPDGKRQEFTGVQADRRYLLTQGKKEAQEREPVKRTIALEPSTPEVPKIDVGTRIPLVTHLPMIPLSFHDKDKIVRTGEGKPTLLILWASWCLPCIAELRELTKHAEELEAAGIQVAALCVDGLGNDKSDPNRAGETVKKLNSPFLFGRANDKLLQYLQLYADSLLMIKEQIGVPTSFLIDPAGRLSVIYRGRVGVDTLLEDIEHNNGSTTERMRRAAYLPGRVIEDPYLDEVRRRREVMIRFPLATTLYNAGRIDNAIEHFLDILEIDPHYPDAHFALGNLYSERRKFRLATERFRRAIELKPDFAEAHYNLALLHLTQKRYSDARKGFEETVRLRPTFLSAYANLGKLDQRDGKLDSAQRHYRTVLKKSFNIECANNLSWIISNKEKATEPEILEALKLAKQLAELSEYKFPPALDTLAAAYAQHGDFESAVKWQTKAVELSKGEEKKLFQSHLDKYKAKKPLREQQIVDLEGNTKKESK